jgi:hypothetical protein
MALGLAPVAWLVIALAGPAVVIFLLGVLAHS